MRTIDHRDGDPSNNDPANLTTLKQSSALVIPAGQSPAMAMVEAITRAASDPTVDAGKMERLWAIAKEAQADQAKREYGEAMARVQAELPKIIKDRENKQTSSRYATLDNIIRQIAPIYTKRGFSLSFDTADSPIEKCIRIVCTAMHEGGHSVRFQYDQPIDDVGIQGSVNKTQVHARGSAVTYGRRYLTLMVFNINTGEDDDGNAAGEKPLDEKAGEWMTKIGNVQDPAQYQEVKRDCIKAYGSSTKVPPKLQAELNKARDAVMPRD